MNNISSADRARPYVCCQPMNIMLDHYLIALLQFSPDKIMILLQYTCC